MKYKATTEHLKSVIDAYGHTMKNQFVVITGTTSGTGFVCARELGLLGATVLLLNRKSARLDDSLQQLQQAVPKGQFDSIICDLQDFESVRKAMQIIVSRYDLVDILVNNAGVMALDDRATKDGYDIQMQTNVLSHFLITKTLFPLLKKSHNARIINHSSMARLGPPLESQYFEKKGGQLGGNGSETDTYSFKGPRWMRYHQTKLANCAFTYGLKQKLDNQGIHHILPLLAHPGLALTQLQVTTTKQGGMDPDSNFMSRAQSAEDGACGILRACLDTTAVSGNFYGPTAGWKGYPELLEPEDYLYSEHNIDVNWAACEAAVGVFKF